jgi:phosphatidylserine/phosphatidylglycerophosphate/cardiolipin synthase-like enzyme
VLVGSANFTNGGFNNNDELMLEVTDGPTMAALADAAARMAERAVGLAR